MHLFPQIDEPWIMYYLKETWAVSDGEHSVVQAVGQS